MGRTRRRRGRNHVLAAVAVAGLAGSIALSAAITVAQAQLPDPSAIPSGDPAALPDPYATGEAAAQDNGAPDTDFTPQAKDTQLWTQIHGAHYPDDHVAPDSVTDFRDSLVTVAFANLNNGFAGGARRIDCGGTPTDVPVLYSYRDVGGTGRTWRLDFVGDCQHPGFVGAIASMPGTNEAVAVGGTGSYPYREPAYRPECQRMEPDPQSGAETNVDAYGVLCDQAGDARAWRFDGDRWREFTGDLPQDGKGDPPRGMTALDFSPTRDDFGFAGGLGQIWRWQGGQFDRLYDMHTPCPRYETRVPPPNPSNEPAGEITPECKFAQGYRFRFRVRQIRFYYADPPTVYAVTDGCCAEDRLHDTPNLLGYTERSSAPQRWYAATLDPATSLAFDEGANNLPTERLVKDSPNRRLNPRQDLPDSFYSLTVDPTSVGSGTRIAAVAAPAAPEGSEPERSLITQAYCVGFTGRHTSGFSFGGVGIEDQTDIPDQAIEALRTRLSTARLVAGDGDIAASFTAINSSLKDTELGNEEAAGGPNEVNAGQTTCTNGSTPRDQPDGVPDWAVGGLGSTRTDLGSRGIAYSTVLRPELMPTTVQGDPNVAQLLAGQFPTDPEKLKAYLASQLLQLSSYSLNAIDVIGETDSGWAVGEHGAIVRLGGSGGRTPPEPDPPRLGSHQTAGLAGGPSYSGSRPAAAGAPGPVPALESRPRLHLDQPRMFAAGSPFPANNGTLDAIEDVNQIVMSRDGSEGWAIGPTATAAQATRPAMTSLFHYDGQSWGRCDPVGVKSQVAPDPACSALAPLRDYHDGNSRLHPARIVAAARVPLEYDGNPSNDDQFEVMALAGPVNVNYPQPPASTESEGYVPVRFQDGRWRIDPDPALSKLVVNNSDLTIAYTSPNDGWILAQDGNQQSPASKLLHYDGTGWVNCTPGGPAPPGCGDAGCPTGGAPGLLCFGQTGEVDAIRGIVASGRDLYLYGSRQRNGSRYPFIIRRHAGGDWSSDPAGGGFDPVAAARDGGPQPTGSPTGDVQSLAVAQRPDGGLDGWAVGGFATRAIDSSSVAGVKLSGLPRQSLAPQTSLMRLGADGWRPFDDSGPVGDYLKTRIGSSRYCPKSVNCNPDLPDTDSNLQATVPDAPSGPTAFIAQRLSGRIFGFYPGRGRWQLIDQPRLPESSSGLDGPVHGLAPDGEGGIWAAIGDTGSNRPHDDFEHFTSNPPEPVFTEAASPLRDGESFTSLAGGQDGTVWASTRSGSLLRYDRALGWDRVSVPGWDPGRVVTRPSQVLAVATGPGGEGIAVGERGRIADLSLDQVRLDPAAGCRTPCGTGRDLLAAAVASDGSAIAGGQAMALLWRPRPDADFQAINPPDAGVTDSITGISMANPGEAYLTTSSGQVFRGTGGAGGWSWERENMNENGDIITLDRARNAIPLRAISVDTEGHGYAVGDDGLMLERVRSGGTAWQRLRTPFAEDLTSVATGVGGGDGALIGGRHGLVLTAQGSHVSLARAADRFSSQGSLTGSVVGLAVTPGDHPGETEAWVATAARDGGFARPESGYDYNSALSQLFHYASDPSDPWLDPETRAKPLPDTPPLRPGELSFAALGRSECRAPRTTVPCVDASSSASDFEVGTERAVSEIAERARQPGGPAFTLFTGDSVDSPDKPGTQETERQAESTAVEGPHKLRRFREAVPDELGFAGVPTFAASGGRDLSGVDVCYGDGCPATTRGVAGDNLAWRQTFEGEPGPWGDGGPPVARSPAGKDLSFEGLSDSGDAVDVPDQSVPDPDQGLPTGDGPLTASKVGTGGARTHYALDISRGGERVARLVVADTSMRSLQASDPMQQPAEPRGQLLWVDRMTCIEGQTATDGTQCTRPAGEQAIVLTNTPTYSYGPGGLSDTDTADGTQLEQVLMQNRVNLVVAGRLGWNGLYYAMAAGLHYPCPGGTYPSGPPTSATQCTGGSEGTPDPTGGGSPSGPLGGSLPFVVASDVAGTFGPDGTGGGSAAAGYWHGYTIVRLSPDGDPAKTIVEQRPVLDWLQIQPRKPQADPHTVRAGKKLALAGVGREPVAASTAGTPSNIPSEETRYDEISTPAITHRFDLLEADPSQPWLPKDGTRDDACDPYDCLASSVARIDPQSGEVKAGSGNFPKTYAVAELSVGAKSATYPLVFEPRASYRPKPPPPSIPAVVPPPASPPAPANPTSPSVSAPPAPTIPVLAAQAPPPPPAPPAPPTFASQAPIDLSITPTALDVSPPTAVSQPPTPPVNPAPPSGARREARQRQAAAQKSGADNEEGAESGREDAGGGDLADGPASPGGVSSTRYDHPFTATATRRQPSAWTRDLALGGGLGIAALILALGLTHARPTPRRRQPEVPAPALSRMRNER